MLILGENGTGKQELARYVHACSGRAVRPLVAVNCGAIARELFESEMFGHERGAFTGAVSAKRGYFEQADGGTLLLDEIGELALDQQHKLLRAIQQQEIRRVGAERVLRVDVRLIAATNRDLWAMVKRGTFREDLYFRVAGWVLRLPPLRERGEDILTIARAALDEEGFADSTWSRDAEQLLLGYSWPGNIRELVNAITAAAVRASGREIAAADLLPGLVEAQSHRSGEPVAADAALDEELALSRAARAAHGLLAQQRSFTRAELAARLGWSRSRSGRMLEKLKRAAIVRERGRGPATRYVAGR